MNIPVNFIRADLPPTIGFDQPPQKLRSDGYEHIHILTDLPQIFPKEFVAVTDGFLKEADFDAKGGGV